MNGLAFLVALAAIPALGWCASRLLPSPRRNWPLRLAVSTGLGGLLLTMVMLFESWAGVPWSIPGLLLPFLALAPVALLFPRAALPVVRFRTSREAIPGLVVAALGLAFCGYVAGSARATSSDLLLFWGTKGERFAAAAGVDLAFLRAPSHFLMHPDYPPLLPFLYSWGALFAGRLPWGATLLILPLWIGLAAAAYWGAARQVLPGRLASERTMLLVLLLGFPTAVTLCAGNAEGPLLFFEVLALSALTFVPAAEHGFLIASLALGGGVLTKVEGTVFAVLVVVAYGAWHLLRSRSARPLLVLASAPALSLFLWWAYAHHFELQDVYRGRTAVPVNLQFLPKIVSAILANSGYRCAYAPWIIVLLLGIAAGSGRPWQPPTVVALGYVAFIVYCYLQADTSDAMDWIGWSAGRLMLTPLVCLFFASTAPRGSGPATNQLSVPS